MIENVREVLFHLGKEFPEWKGRGYQIVGFAWHQGTSDKAPDKVVEEYQHNLPDFIASNRRPTVPDRDAPVPGGSIFRDCGEDAVGKPKV